eukprot:4675875-Amphidinium_carterae.1
MNFILDGIEGLLNRGEGPWTVGPGLGPVGGGPEDVNPSSKKLLAVKDLGVGLSVLLSLHRLYLSKNSELVSVFGCQ